MPIKKTEQINKRQERNNKIAKLKEEIEYLEWLNDIEEGNTNRIPEKFYQKLRRI